MSNDGARKAAARRAATIGAMRIMGEDLLGRSVNDTPVEEGTLRGSGQTHTTVRGDRVETEVSFGTVYAARQHEEVTWKHPKGGKAKYLEDNLKAMAPRYLAALAAAVRKVT